MATHYPAETVISPKDCIDSVTVLYDGGPILGEFSIAIIEWQGSQCIGIRWNINERELDDPDKASGKIRCIGEQNSRGYPTWFILPDRFLDDILNGNRFNNNIANEIKKYTDKKMQKSST